MLQTTWKVALMQKYRWPTYTEVLPFYLPGFAIYSTIIFVFLGLATAGLGYQYSVSQVVPMTVTSELLMCRYDNTEPARQNKNSVSHDAPCDDKEQAERLKQEGFIYVRPTLLKLKLSTVSPHVFSTQLALSRNLHQRYHVGQTVAIRLSKLRENERAELADDPPNFAQLLPFLKISCAVTAMAWFALFVLNTNRRRKQRKAA
jgi:hypothetical protein